AETIGEDSALRLVVKAKPFGRRSLRCSPGAAALTPAHAAALKSSPDLGGAGRAVRAAWTRRSQDVGNVAYWNWSGSEMNHPRQESKELWRQNQSHWNWMKRRRASSRRRLLSN